MMFAIFVSVTVQWTTFYAHLRKMATNACNVDSHRSDLSTQAIEADHNVIETPDAVFQDLLKIAADTQSPSKDNFFKVQKETTKVLLDLSQDQSFLSFCNANSRRVIRTLLRIVERNPDDALEGYEPVLHCRFMMLRIWRIPRNYYRGVGCARTHQFSYRNCNGTASALSYSSADCSSIY